MKKDNLMVSVKNINKSYKDKHVLHDINLDIKKGERVSIIGGNGSGKSTLVEIISKNRKANSGEVKYSKNSIVGIQFQESVYPDGITVNSLINFYFNRYKIEMDQKAIEKLLDQFRLLEFRKKQVKQMSGGQQQRLNILLALIHKPNILILDELSTGLDIKVRSEVTKIIKDYLHKSKDVTLILVTHSMHEAETLTDRIVVLDWGKITHDLPVKEIVKKHGSVDKFATKLFEQMYKEGDHR